MTKMTKKETHYSYGMEKSHCGKVFSDDKGYCRHFIASSQRPTKVGTCEIVEGEIKAVYWCDQFKKAK